MDNLKEYIEKLNGIVGVERRKFIISNSIAFVVLSSNDIANTYFGSGTRTLQYDIPSYCDFLVSGASEFFKVIQSINYSILNFLYLKLINKENIENKLEKQTVCHFASYAILNYLYVKSVSMNHECLVGEILSEL